MQNSQQTDPALSSTDTALFDSHSLLNWAVSPEDGHCSESSMDTFVFGWSLVQMFGEQRSTSGATGMPARTLPEQLASLLLALSEREAGLPTVQHVSTSDLAAALGSSREAVASLLRAFRRQRLIDVRHDAIKLVDLETLAEIAG